MNESTLKSALVNIQAKNTEHSFDELLQSMESPDQDPGLRQLASLLRSFAQKNTQELSEILGNTTGKLLLSQLSQLISLEQTFLSQQIVENNDSEAKNEETLAQCNKEDADLSAQIAQATAEINAQEERKACKF